MQKRELESTLHFNSESASHRWCTAGEAAELPLHFGVVVSAQKSPFLLENWTLHWRWPALLPTHEPAPQEDKAGLLIEAAGRSSRWRRGYCARSGPQAAE